MHPPAPFKYLVAHTMYSTAEPCQAVVVANARADLEPLVSACLGAMLQAVFALLQVG